MRRVLAILKYVPAVLCGLLVVAWVVSVRVEFGSVVKTYKYYFNVHFDSGSFHLSCSEGVGSKSLFYFYSDFAGEPLLGIEPFMLGELRSTRYPFRGRQISLPIPLLLVVLLPVYGGLLDRFRFPLWSYFAWTALLAAELAYYLR